MAKTLLLVEDDAVERSLMSDALRQLPDIHVVAIEGGPQAVDYLREHGPQSIEAPSVVFLDLQMPILNGFEVLRDLQAQVEAYRVPVVVFTASRSDADVYLSYKFGANAFVVKPAEPGRLQEVVRTAADFWLRCNVLPPMR